MAATVAVAVAAVAVAAVASFRRNTGNDEAAQP